MAKIIKSEVKSNGLPPKLEYQASYDDIVLGNAKRELRKATMIRGKILRFREE